MPLKTLGPIGPRAVGERVNIIIINISFIIILVYNIDFFHKSKGQSLKLQKYKLSYKVILENNF